LESTKPVLHIFMGHAQNLPLVGNEQPPDSYVKTYIQPDRDRSTKRKSGVVRNNQNPTYNEEVRNDLI
jgi:Ca2+-dependent lipid-binding protein